ncbi:MAG: radical SAM protein [Candidatus Lokiarchaeota archaeon]|nr:radical SAM protein [Candidatus Lokiarchaeota archaeon]MBD3342642.1 radical SAM protein [Candidatus Lokiarchaeota archaeon]
MPLNTKANLPRNITLQLTEACNLRCKMCYYWGEKGCYSNDASDKKPASLNPIRLKQLIEELESAKPHYSLFGGEPLTYNHLKDIVIAIKNAGSSVDTPTNGTLLKNYSSMLVKTGFDLVRVSIDGTEEFNDIQRGKGSYNKAMEGIEILYNEKQSNNSKSPSIEIISTITPDTYRSIEQFILNDLNLEMINIVTLQIVNFITEEMGQAYSKMLKKVFEIQSDKYWRCLVSSTDAFNSIDTKVLSKQIIKIRQVLREKKINLILEPPNFTPANLDAYFKADWDNMIDQYETCYVPWVSTDITATGEVAPCHIFYDLVMGNIYEQSFEDIWNNKKFQLFRDYMNKFKLMPICYGCCILYLAGKKKRSRFKKL